VKSLRNVFNAGLLRLTPPAQQDPLLVVGAESALTDVAKEAANLGARIPAGFRIEGQPGRRQTSRPFGGPSQP